MCYLFKNKYLFYFKYFRKKNHDSVSLVDLLNSIIDRKSEFIISTAHKANNFSTICKVLYKKLFLEEYLSIKKFYRSIFLHAEIKNKYFC